MVMLPQIRSSEWKNKTNTTVQYTSDMSTPHTILVAITISQTQLRDFFRENPYVTFI